MTKDVFKVVGLGILAGIVFAFPFILFRLLAVLLVFALIRRLLWGPRWGWWGGYGPWGHPAFSGPQAYEKFRQMSPEERAEWWKQWKQQRHGCHGRRWETQPDAEQQPPTSPA